MMTLFQIQHCDHVEGGSDHLLYAELNGIHSYYHSCEKLVVFVWWDVELEV